MPIERDFILEDAGRNKIEIMSQKDVEAWQKRHGENTEEDLLHLATWRYQSKNVSDTEIIDR